MGFISQQTILNTRLQAFGDNEEMQSLKRAQAYYDNQPGETASNARLGIPREKWPKVIIPLPRRIVDTSAAFLFGRPPGISVPGNPALTEWIHEVVSANDLQSQLVALARRGGIDGKVALKFAYDPDNRANPFPINILSKSCFRERYDDLNRREMKSFVIQFRYKSEEDGRIYWYREEWTPDTWRLFEPIASDSAEGSHYRTEMSWQVREEYKNPFGFIPVVVIKNIVDAEDPSLGISDLEGLYDLFDRINIAYDQWDESNAIAARRIYFGKRLTSERLELRPGDVVTGNMEDSDLKAVTGGESIYVTLRDYAERLEHHVIAAARSTLLDSNKMQAMNNLSSVALRMLHTDLLTLTEEKRSNYGVNGIGKFLSLLILAAQRVGYSDRRLPDETRRVAVRLSYPPAFPLTESERGQALQNLAQAKSLGILSEDQIQAQASVLYGFQANS